MPHIRKMTIEEATTLANKGKGKRKLIQAEYDQFLADFASGEYGEAQLEPGENRLTVRNRLKAAAGRRGLDIVFRRMRGDMIRFMLEEQAAHKQGILGKVASAVTGAVSSILPKEPASVTAETLPARKPGRKKSETVAVISGDPEPAPASEIPATKKRGRKKGVA